MSRRELRRHAGRLVIAGFTGHSIPDDLRRLVAAFDLGGVILFSRNVVEPRQVSELCREAAALARHWPFWVSVDQEGGRVARLRAPFTKWPPMRTLGRAGDDGLARRFATALAAELRAVGINLDFTPVLDVDTNPDNPVIGDRAFSRDPADVARLGAVIIDALQDAGVAACGKHFPGHGDTLVDSHEALPVVEHDRRRLDAVEWVPFRRAVEAGVAAIMTAHVQVPALDADRVATCSPRVVTDILKDTFGFGGVVMSDDLGMQAMSNTLALPEASVASVAAGCDVLLLCNATVDAQWTAIEAVIRAAEDGTLSASRLDDALARQQAVKTRIGSRAAAAPGLDVVGCEAHRAVAAEMEAWQ
jgi:beta-N-acetylhexosaminidase